jgi:hypothetical protein
MLDNSPSIMDIPCKPFSDAGLLTCSQLRSSYACKQATGAHHVHCSDHK